MLCAALLRGHCEPHWVSMSVTGVRLSAAGITNGGTLSVAGGRLSQRFLLDTSIEHCQNGTEYIENYTKLSA